MIDILCKPVIEQFKIDRFIETGAYQGESLASVSRWFSELHPDFGKIDHLVLTDAKAPTRWASLIPYPVFKECENSSHKIYSVEINPEFHNTVKNLFSSNSNIIFACESSERYLQHLIHSNALNGTHNCFFYLDAHWGEYWPLRDEIKQIVKLPRFVISIDDFKVPGHRNFRYDSYGGKDCRWSYIRDLFRGKKVHTYYPKRSNRDNRGWVLIFHGYSKGELRFLKKLPLFEVARWRRLW
jgi:hypothetical protein